MTNPSQTGTADPAPFEEAVKALVQQVQKANPQVSDLVSTESGTTVQWIDLVLAGGGMLGIAHVGFTYVLEKAGIRFRGIAGTSAGAINAALIVGLRPGPAGESGAETLKYLASAPFSKFMDGDADVKELQNVILGRVGGAAPKNLNGKKIGGLKALLQKINPWRFVKWLGILGDVRFIGPILKIVNNRGMYPGDFFQQWMKELMDRRAPTVDKLYDCLKLPPLHIKQSRLEASKGTARAAEDKELLQNTKGDLAILASDITTETKAVFPDHTRLYYDKPGQVSPSEFVRMSMSIPVFFQPKEVGVPQDVIASGAWKTAPGVSYDGTFPPPETEGPFKGRVKITFVDGGTLSNFPIAHFHNRGVPLLPTFGARLSEDREDYSKTSNLLELFHAMNDASRHILDREFLFENPDYQKLVTTIDTSGFNWLNFDMAREEQIRLFQRGAEAAASFLLGPPLAEDDTLGLKGRDASKGFDWEGYKKIRAALSQLPEPEAP